MSKAVGSRERSRKISAREQHSQAVDTPAVGVVVIDGIRCHRRKGGPNLYKRHINTATIKSDVINTQGGRWFSESYAQRDRRTRASRRLQAQANASHTLSADLGPDRPKSKTTQRCVSRRMMGVLSLQSHLRQARVPALFIFAVSLAHFLANQIVCCFFDKKKRTSEKGKNQTTTESANAKHPLIARRLIDKSQSP